MIGHELPIIAAGSIVIPSLHKVGLYAFAPNWREYFAD